MILNTTKYKICFLTNNGRHDREDQENYFSVHDVFTKRKLDHVEAIRHKTIKFF